MTGGEPDASETGRSLARRLAWDLYLPWVMAGLGRGMLLPIVPLYLREEGLSYSMIAVILAGTGIGAVLGGLPVGSMANRLGPERLFVAATVISAVAAALFGISTAVLALFAFRFALGVGGVGLRISLQVLVRDATDERSRGRGMAILGGGMRASSFVGPLLGGVSVDLFGFGLAFVLCGVFTLVGLIPFLQVRRGRPDGRFAARPTNLAGIRSALANHRSLLLLAGIGPAMVITVRAGRDIIMPLIGEDLGLSATAIGALVAIGTGADLLLFPVSGWLMDRFGRLAAIVPAFSLLGIGMLILGLAPSTAGAIIAGATMGIGNGMSAGTMLTLGADIAPTDAGPFLAAFGMMQDVGQVMAPLVIGALADSADLNTSAIVLGLLMFVGIAWIVVSIGDTAHPSRPWLVKRLLPPSPPK